MKPTNSSLCTTAFLVLILYLSQSCSLSSKGENPKETILATYQALYQEDSIKSSLDEPRKYYTSVLASHIEQEKLRREKTGQIGLLVSDPLCSCQDPASVEAFYVNLEEEMTDSATAFVTVKMNGLEEQNIQLLLSKEQGNWRIADVRSSSYDGLREIMSASSNAR